MIYKLTLTEEVIMTIHHALHAGAEEVIINEMVIPFEKTKSGRFMRLDVQDTTVRRGEIRFQKQNPAKQSRYGKMAREGHKITWGICDPPQDWLLVIDEKIKIFR